MEAEGPHPKSAPELKAQIEAEREGRPFLVFRDAAGEQVLAVIDSATTELWVGRSEVAGVRLDWDESVSTLHARVEVVGEECVIEDDGLSRNGSFLNGDRIQGRRRLRDGDMLRFGRTVVIYRAPAEASFEMTAEAGEMLPAASVSPAQRRVLVALCRPFKGATGFATPATNGQIAEELHLSVDAVKTHLRALFEKFEVEALPQNRKRVALVEKALQSGLITERDL